MPLVGPSLGGFVAVNHSHRITSSNKATEGEMSHSNILTMCCDLYVSSLQATSACLPQHTLLQHCTQEPKPLSVPGPAPWKCLCCSSHDSMARFPPGTNLCSSSDSSEAALIPRSR